MCLIQLKICLSAIALFKFYLQNKIVYKKHKLIFLTKNSLHFLLKISFEKLLLF